ncbi:MAG: sugar transferase, partial [Chloroflexota bacterium]|nr:sugar transferase [Chloroflexota bacterium]
MIRRHLMALRVGLMLGDALTAVIVFLVVSHLRFRDGAGTLPWDALGIDVRFAAILFAATWVVVLWSSGLYRLEVRWRLWTEARDVVRASIVVMALTLSALFLLRQPDVSRLFLVFLFVAQPSVTLLGRFFLRSVFEWMRRRGQDRRYMLVVGVGDLAQAFADRVEQHAGLGIEIIGHLAAPEEQKRVVTRSILGSVDEIHDVLHTQVVDEVAVCLPSEAARYLEPITGLAAGEGKTVRIPVDPVEEILPSAVLEEFDGFVVRSLVNDGHREVGLILKRILDIVGSALGLLILSPILLGAAIAIRMLDGEPVLFRQTRIGLHGRPFTIYKFRTMVVGAEEQLDDVRHLNERTGAAFKASDDPRVTGVGRRLRRTSIDELPQLWNVLRGEMSLVGPRPLPCHETDACEPWQRQR